MPVISAFQGLRQEDGNIENKLGYMQSLSQENKSSYELEIYITVLLHFTTKSKRPYVCVCLHVLTSCT